MNIHAIHNLASDYRKQLATQIFYTNYVNATLRTLHNLRYQHFSTTCLSTLTVAAFETILAN